MYEHIQCEKRCIIVSFNQKSVDTKYTVFLALAVALVVDYSLKLRNMCFELPDFERHRNLERTPEPQPESARASNQELHASVSP